MSGDMHVSIAHMHATEHVISFRFWPYVYVSLYVRLFLFSCHLPHLDEARQACQAYQAYQVFQAVVPLRLSCQTMRKSPGVGPVPSSGEVLLP